MGNNNLSFSVCMAVYHRDDPRHFIDAVHSVTIYQTVKPSELIIIVDGPLTNELEDSLKKIQQEIPYIKSIRFHQNRGHAATRQAGLDAASNNLVAIMDSDDLAVPNRFEIQLKAYQDHPEVAVIGGQIREFIEEPNNIVGERIVPETDEYIKKYLKSRCPMNLVTVMYRKDAVKTVGGFMEWYCEEDYYLWIRLAQHGFQFYNVNENLVNVRVGKEMYRRRGGWKYFKSEAQLQYYMLKHQIISTPRYIYNTLGRFLVQVVMPNRLRGFVFQKLFRK